MEIQAVLNLLEKLNKDYPEYRGFINLRIFDDGSCTLTDVNANPIEEFVGWSKDDICVHNIKSLQELMNIS